MTKILEQIQKENRKFILEAIHCCSYEEALKKEMGYNCEVLVMIWGKNPHRYIVDNLICCFDGDYLRFRELVGDISERDLTDEGLEKLKEYESARYRIIEVIGKPLTLSRVLLAFKNKDVKTCYEDEIIFNIAGPQFCGLQLEEEYHNPHYSLYGAGDWNLELETLEEQSEETQTKINELFTKDS